MFFILVYGWDGLGYDRFFYDRDMLAGSPAWTPGVVSGGTWLGLAGAALRFLVSSVARTLYLDGIYLLPPFFWLFVRWFRAGERAIGASAPDAATLVRRYLGAVFGVALPAAIFCACVVNGVGAVLGVADHLQRGLGQAPPATGAHVLSYLLGLPLALAVLWWSVLAPGRWVSRWLAPLCGASQPATPVAVERHEAAPLAPAAA
jgi:hypothetical protein